MLKRSARRVPFARNRRHHKALGRAGHIRHTARPRRTTMKDLALFITAALLLEITVATLLMR